MISLDDKHSFYSIITNWVMRFRTGYLGSEDGEHSGWPTHVTVQENVDTIQSTILDDQRIFTKKIAETLVVSWERVVCIIREILDMRKLSVGLAAKCLNPGQKSNWMLASQAMLDQFWRNPVEFFNHLITMNWTWIPPYKWYRDKRTIQRLQTQCCFLISEILQDTKVIKQCVGICLLWQRWSFACRLPAQGYSHRDRVLNCTSQQEAALGLQTSRQTSKRKLVSSGQFCSSQGSHYTPEHGRYPFWSSETPGTLAWFGPLGLLPLSWLEETRRPEKIFEQWEATLAVDRWFADNQNNFSWIR
jgi:hypothetical protein